VRTLKNNKLGELNFADLSEKEMRALKNAEDAINTASGKKIYLMALCKD
jgi:hypothetical protein